MSDFNFGIRLRAYTAQFGQRIRQAGVTTQQTFSQMATQARNARESIRRQFSSSANDVTPLSQGVASLTSRIIALGATYLGINALKNAIGGIINTGAKFEQLETQINTLMGSIEEGDKATEWIKEFAKTTPAELEGVTEGFIRLKAFGIDPMDGSYQAIVDQTSKLGFSQEKMEGVILAVGQAWSKQKLQGEEALQLIERGVPVWDLLAEATGRSSVEIQKMATAGKLGRKEIKLLLDEMGRSSAGAAETQMSTWNGMISNLTDTWTDFVNQIADAGVFEFAKTQLKEMLDLATAMAEDGRMAEAAQQISDYIVTAATRIKGYVVEVAADFDGLVNGAQKVMAGFSLAFNVFTAGVKAIAADVSRSISEILDALANGLEAANFDDAANNLREKAGAMAAVSNAFKEELAQDAKDIKAAWATLNNQSFDGAESGISDLKKASTQAKTQIVSDFDAIAAQADSTSEQIRNAFVSGINAAKTAEEVQQLVTEFRELGVDGRVATDHLVTGLSRVDGALQSVAKQAANAKSAVNGISVSNSGMSSYVEKLDEAAESQKEKTEATEADTAATKTNTAEVEKNGGAASASAERAGTMASYTYKLAGLARDQWVSMGQSMSDAFDGFVQRTQDYQKQITQSGNRTAGAFMYLMNNAYALAANQAERLVKRYNAQTKSAERFIEKLSDTTTATAEVVEQAERAVSNYDLLGDEQLSALRSAIAAVKAETDSLNDSLSSTLNTLRDELDSLNNDTLSIETRAYKNQLADLNEQLDRAQELGSKEAIKSAREAISLLKETYKIKKQAIVEEAASNISNNTSASPTSTPSAANTSTTSRTVNIQIGSKTQAISVADSASEAALINALEDIQAASL
ncbi:tape measure protein [Neptunomonas sp.]|uniref:tape measure protein n=1 Tax=Neptunomonas TaxID=75687 RepID=UPI0035115BA0